MNLTYEQLVTIITDSYNIGLDSDNPSVAELESIIQDAVIFIETEDK